MTNPVHGSERAWQHPWPRIQLLLRSISGTRWDSDTWPTIKAELNSAMELRAEIQQAGWFN